MVDRRKGRLQSAYEIEKQQERNKTFALSFSKHFPLDENV
jgi:hypothetical protein